jgi:MoxR-like ATPase
VIAADSHLEGVLESVLEGVADATGRLENHRSRDFKRFERIWSLDKPSFMRRFAKQRQPIEQYSAEMDRILNEEAEVRTDIENVQNFGFVQADHSLFKGALLEHCAAWQRYFTRLINDTARKDLDALHAKIAESTRALSSQPDNLEALSRNAKLARELRRERTAIEECFTPLEAL